MLATNMSFSETAKKLYITQSALSRHISAIEEEIGAKLLVRDSHHVRLTEVGKSFLEDSKLTVQAHDNAIDHVDQLKKGSKRILRIGYLYDAARNHLPLITKVLGQTASNIIPQYQTLEYGDLMNQLFERKIDVAITMDIDQKIHSSTRCVCLDYDEYFATVPKNHALAQQESVTLEELAREPIIFPDPNAMGAMHQFFSKAIKAEETRTFADSYYRDIPSLIYQIEAGEGISVIFGHHRQRYSTNVAFVPISNPAETCSICIMWDVKSQELIPGKWPQAFELLAQGKTRNL